VVGAPEAGDDVPVPEPITVWMVHLSSGASLDGVEGLLSLHNDAVVFTESSAARVERFPLESVRKAKRLRGSPVLRLDWLREDGPRRTAFFFVQPPPLEPPEFGVRRSRSDPFSTEPASGLAAMRRPSKRRQMRANSSYLQTSGIRRSEVIKAWADAITDRLNRG
jgi:hypothetical protein